MSDAEGSEAAAGRAPAEEELLSADRRTLVVGALAMVGLILLGVVSGSLFARSACDDIGPQRLALRTAGRDPQLLVGALGGLGRDELTSIQVSLDQLTAELGPIIGIAEVSDATGLAALADGVAALGDRIVALAGPGDAVEAAASLGAGTAVGDGDHLYSLALTNPLTGQVDALQPLDDDLSGLTCQDTALVGSPLAFHLDAGDGQLLVLRIDEDGDEPELELRDPVDGQVWSAGLVLPTAPAGLAGARLTASLGPGSIVAGSRTTPGEEAPVLTAVARGDGAEVWTLDRADLAAAGAGLSEDGPTRAEVVAVGDALALVVLREVDGDGRADEEAEQDARAVGPQRLLAVDPSDGTVRWQFDLRAGERVVAADSAGEAARVVLVDLGRQRPRLLAVEAGETRELTGPERPSQVAAALETGGPEGTAAGAIGGAGIAALPGRGAVVATGAAIVLVEDAVAAAADPPAEPVQWPMPVVDVVRHPGGVSLLLVGDGSSRAVVTFSGVRPAR